MDWKEALELVVSRTGHARYRDLCAEDHPDRERYRAVVIARATGRATPLPSHPSLATMATNAVGALGRVVAAVARGEPVKVPAEVYEERLAICRGCPEFDPGPSRCRRCGCFTMAKLRGAQEACPLDPPRWDRWEPAG